MEYDHAEHDLLQEYRGYLKAEPDNGALIYLLGRQTADHAEASRLWERALAAPVPCNYAHAAMGFDAICDARFAEALAHFTAAEKDGTSTASRKHYRRLIHWALNQPALIITELAPARKAEPLDLVLATEEIRATLAVSPDGVAAKKLKDAYLASYQTLKPGPKEVAAAEAYLQAAIDYQNGRLVAFANNVSHLESPYYKFQAAFTRGELKPAAEIIMAQERPRTTELLLLYLLARSKGDQPAADAHFQRALAAMKTESREHRQAAALIATGEPSARTICDLHIDVDEKRVLLTALGVHRPADQAAYFDMARKMNFNPEFPQQFLRPILAQTLK